MTEFINITNCGVPQRSILGPILFLIFINDLPMHVKISYLYSDDTMIEASGHTIETVIDSLQSQIDSWCNWFKHNHLNVNAAKSCSMIIGSRQRVGSIVTKDTLNLKINGELITNKTNYMYLGLHIDSFLTFDIMNDSVCNKLRSRVSLIYRLKLLCHPTILNNIYSTIY